MECITEAVAVLGIPESIMEHDDLAPYVQGANEETDDGDEGMIKPRVVYRWTNKLCGIQIFRSARKA